MLETLLEEYRTSVQEAGCVLGKLPALLTAPSQTPPEHTSQPALHNPLSAWRQMAAAKGTDQGWLSGDSREPHCSLPTTFPPPLPPSQLSESRPRAGLPSFQACQSPLHQPNRSLPLSHQPIRPSSTADQGSLGGVRCCQVRVGCWWVQGLCRAGFMWEGARQAALLFPLTKHHGPTRNKVHRPLPCNH